MSFFGKQGFHLTRLCVVLFMVLIYLTVSERVEGYPIASDVVEELIDKAVGEILQTSPRIVGGSGADIKDYPFLVSIQVRGQHICGGSLMSYRWVLTAAHCITSRIMRRFMRVVAGTTHNTDHGKDVQQRRVEFLVMHYRYSSRDNLNDIGLVKVNEEFEPSPVVSLVKLPKAQSEDLDPFVGTTATCAGWGTTAFMGDESPVLMKVDLKIVSAASCQKAYHYLSQPEYMFLCAKERGKDACQGDSGGPLLHKGVQIGVVSYGEGCAGNSPGVYTRVDSYLHWLGANGQGHQTKANSICLLLWAWIISLS